MAKFSLLTTLTLSASGFDQGLNKAKQSTKDFAKGVETAKNSVKSSFSNISGLAGGLGDGLNSSLGGLPNMLTGALSGFRAMVPAINSTKTALIASGIGAIVVALGLAFAALTSYLTGTSEGAMKIKAAFGYISGAATALMNRLKSLGQALFSILTGNIVGFKAAIADAFKGGFIDEVIAGAKTGNALAEEQNRLKREKNVIDSEELDVLYKQAELTKKAKDVTKESNYTAAQRLAFEKEAIKIGDDFDEKKMKFLKDSWNLETNLNKQKTQLNQQDIEKEIQAKKAYFDYVIKDQQDAIGENKIIAKTQKEIDGDAIAAAKERIVLEKQYRVEKIKGVGFTQDSLKPKGVKELNKQVVIPLEFKKLDANTASLDAFANTQQKIFNQGLSGWAKLGLVMKEAGNSGSNISNTLMGVGETVGNLNAIFSEQTIAYKAFAIAQAGISTFLGASQVLADKTVPTFLKPVLMGSIIGLGLANVAKIAGFANGGIVGGNSISGDKVLARVNSKEMILNQQQQANLFAMANTGGGAGGGEVVFRIGVNELVGTLNRGAKRVNNMR